MQNFNNLPNGPFALRGAKLPYDSYTGDTPHRLFEMWQQSDCNITHAAAQNPSGCLNDLYPFVITNFLPAGVRQAYTRAAKLWWVPISSTKFVA